MGLLGSLPFLRGATEPHLPLLEAFRHNGFVVLPRVFEPDALGRIAEKLRQGQQEYERGLERELRGIGDATNRVPVTRDVLFDPRLLTAIRRVLGGQIRFLQASDLHCGFVQGNWHRDCANKKAGHGPDWADDPEAPTYTVAKAMIYFEVEQYGFCVVPGSHREVRSTKFKKKEGLDAYTMFDSSFDNRLLSKEELHRKTMIRPRPGDVVLFDLRLKHRGQALAPNGVEFVEKTNDKLTLSFVFGHDNAHAERFYSFRTKLKPRYSPMDPAFERELRKAKLLLDTGQSNYFDRYPEEKEFVVLK